MLPKAFAPLTEILKSIAKNKNLFEKVRFHFIGTGKSPNDDEGHNIKGLAQQFGLWESIIFEYPKRIPYLDVLAHLQESDGAFILGSTEPHYTPSKVYQSVLSGKPVFAVLHAESTACETIRQTNAGVTLAFLGEDDLQTIGETFIAHWQRYLSFSSDFSAEKINKERFEEYSAFSVTRILAEAMNRALEKQVGYNKAVSVT